MPAYLPSSGKGDVNWRNLTDNWTHDDTAWLQERSVTRIGNSYTIGTPGTSGDNVLYNISEGRVFYNVDTKILAVSNGTTLDPVFKSSNVKIVDGSTTSEILGISASSGTGITINKTSGALAFGASSFSSTVSITGALSVADYLTSVKVGTAGSLSTSSAGLILNTTGSNAVTFTTSTAINTATTLEVDKPLRVSGALVTTSSATVVGLTVNGTTGLNGNVTVGTGSTLTTPALTVSGATTAAAITASGLITANANITVGGTTPTIQSASAKDLTVTVPANQAIRMTAPSGSDANANRIYYGATTAQNAWIVYGADPGVANVPEGTIWIS